MSEDVQIRLVNVEFLRPGPPHNQLLSPVTQYLAVCGDAGAGVVTVPYEQARFDRLLKALRYETGDPEDRMGMLFWRTHRAARIIFSLRFHMGTMTPQEAVDFLVDKVGHERANAEGEVRRSFAGDYEPLYQAAYMLGGLQIYALHRELVVSRKMTEKQFHDAILQGGRMPIEMVRARLHNQLPGREYVAKWKFAR